MAAKIEELRWKLKSCTLHVDPAIFNFLVKWLYTQELQIFEANHFTAQAWRLEYTAQELEKKLKQHWYDEDVDFVKLWLWQGI
jgi:hypothetical protein